MKNILSYYYHFAQISLHYRDGVYFFEKDQVLYIFKEVKRNRDKGNISIIIKISFSLS